MPEEGATEDIPLQARALSRPAWAEANKQLREYYDTEWGMPVVTERELFERLVLEGFQAGLSWSTILAKRDAFRLAFADFEVELVSLFDEERVEILAKNPNIIRNRQKIRGAIKNAKAALELRQTYPGGLPALLWSYRPETSPVYYNDEDFPTTSPESEALAADLRSRGFTFVGPTTIYALMCAVGIVDGHPADSPRRGSSGLWNADGTRKAEVVLPPLMAH